MRRKISTGAQPARAVCSVFFAGRPGAALATLQDLRGLPVLLARQVKAGSYRSISARATSPFASERCGARHAATIRDADVLIWAASADYPGARCRLENSRLMATTPGEIRTSLAAAPARATTIAPGVGLDRLQAIGADIDWPAGRTGGVTASPGSTNGRRRPTPMASFSS